ncbi:cholecystokinin-like [Poecilia latipinna]|uniref:Gastrin/cholecystokinin peptide hormone domain-containing protein n=2 Tax=Poecilia TaxID=8080 RepID=A0A3B3UK99_9TELE|nr:PREDICTED: cholecystokinin-like [Poecilia formosa]XP_014865155.1 PREDICTED: cholecystokinin-like [Poecilia mexicana]XP_014908793.1 PREDICTED: cholecystokinin-like [Poecilia latipinna]
MTVGLCVCAVLAVLCSSCFGLPFSPQPVDEDQRYFSVPSQAVFEADAPTLGETHLRHSRSSPQLKPFSQAEEDADSRANLSELLARLISSRKGSVRRNSMAQKKGGGLDTKHRIADRDYIGWMDFGRRSAEEFEYAS